MKIYDLSPTLSSRTAVFPGDVSFRRDVSMSFSEGHHLALSSITTTLHVGAHADAVSHYSAQGAGIDRARLGRYVGSTVVVRANVPRGERVGFEHLSPFGRDWILGVESGASKVRRADKFLVSTGTFPDPDHWNSDFASYDPQLITRLHGVGIRLIGIDTPSIDPETSKKLESHHTIEKLEMSVLEGLCMNGVPEGIFWMVAAPLKIEGGDAGPVRALLFDAPAGSFPEGTEFSSVECESVK